MFHPVLLVLLLPRIVGTRTPTQPCLGLEFPRIILKCSSDEVVSRDNLTTTLPLLHLPYATYQATDYDRFDDIYTFKNIRFAAPPTGRYRFSPPRRQKKMTKIQDRSVGNACPQAVPTMFLVARPPAEGLRQ